MAVYFVRNVSSGAIKIGYSVEPRKRLAQLQTATVDPLLLEAIIPGDMNRERELHRQFAEYRINGEWFAGNAIGREIEKLKQEVVDSSASFEPAIQLPTRNTLARIVGLIHVGFAVHADRTSRDTVVVAFQLAGSPERAPVVLSHPFEFTFNGWPPPPWREFILRVLGIDDPETGCEIDLSAALGVIVHVDVEFVPRDGGFEFRLKLDSIRRASEQGASACPSLSPTPMAIWSPAVINAEPPSDLCLAWVPPRFAERLRRWSDDDS